LVFQHNGIFKNQLISWHTCVEDAPVLPSVCMYVCMYVYIHTYTHTQGSTMAKFNIIVSNNYLIFEDSIMLKNQIILKIC